MKPIIPYKLVPLSDEELANLIALREAALARAEIIPHPDGMNRHLLFVQEVRAAAKFITDNFPIGSAFDLNGFDTLVIKQVTDYQRPMDRKAEAMGITLLLIIKDKGVPARVEHLHLTVEFLREYTKDWPIA